MVYQPPLFGHKTLLNFDAWSYPDVGGWVLFGSITLAVLVFLYEWRSPRKPAA
jgi:copper chaperone NosL